MCSRRWNTLVSSPTTHSGRAFSDWCENTTPLHPDRHRATAILSLTSAWRPNGTRLTVSL
jgi:hypothetical protein